MNPQQQTFVSEMLRHGNKHAAYRAAYPGDKNDKTVESAVNRLLKHPEVKAAIDEPTRRIRAEAEATLKERMQAELLSLHEVQQTLTQIVRGQYTTRKQVRLKGGFETIEVHPTVTNVLTAINAYLRIVKAPSNSPQGGELKTPVSFPPPWGEPEGALPPPWGELEGASAALHPFGDIYPKDYPGPYYDPADPNTKEKIQNLNFDRLTDCEVQPRQPTQKSSPPSQGGVSRRDGVVATQQEPENTTIHNNTTLPLLRGVRGVSARNEQTHPANAPIQPSPLSRGEIQEQNTTIHNNICPPELRNDITTCKNWKNLSARTQQTLLRDALRKQGWLTTEDAANLVGETYLRNQHSGTRHMLKLFEKAKAARNDPPATRQLIEKETGWAWHPQYPGIMKRTRPL